MTTHRFDALWQNGVWLKPAFVSVDARGDVTRIANTAPDGGVEDCKGLAVPGIANLHSHAFQRALVGRAEWSSGHSDSFWTWRDAMYRFVEGISPEQVEAIATWLYVEMLEAGYTSVGEFHYLHHDPDGRPYADPAELSLRLLSAAERAGIGITLLPVLYANGGFDGRGASAEQRRFVNSVGELLRIVERAQVATQGNANATVGVAPHSLRAVSLEMLRELLAAVPAESPVHIHISEQKREVQECRAATGTTPLALLMSAAELDGRWCLVHGTHATESEIARLAKTGATVALCPTTEANLGDGLPPMAGLIEEGVGFGIGSDSQVCVCPAEELRLLEYEQRLVHGRRNVLSSAEQPSVAERLLGEVGRSASRALGRRLGELVVGARADLVTLDPNSAALAGLPPERHLDAWVFGARVGAVRDVMVGGNWVVWRGRHPKRDALLQAYMRALDGIA